MTRLHPPRMTIPAAFGVAHCAWWIALREGPENDSPQSPAIPIGPVSFVEPGDDR